MSGASNAPARWMEGLGTQDKLDKKEIRGTEAYARGGMVLALSRVPSGTTWAITQACSPSTRLIRVRYGTTAMQQAHTAFPCRARDPRGEEEVDAHASGMAVFARAAGGVTACRAKGPNNTWR